MNIKKRIWTATATVAVMLAVTPARAGAQELSAGGDLVSSYIWRGAYCGGVSVQPALSFSAGGFSLTAWGSVGFTSPAYLDEFDFTLGYGIGGLALAVTDYWFVYRMDEPASDYFNYRSDETAHMFEATLGYDFGPLALSWNTFFAGADFKPSDPGKRAYSTYIEASAPFKVGGGYGLSLELGVTPWEGLYADGFRVANIGITGSKEIRVTDSFTVPAFSKVIFNPAARQTYFVFGISL